MATADLHVHSVYSEKPAGWYMQQFGASECYTDPEEIYWTAKIRGMSYVTVTDHNRIDGALLLKEKHPEDTFTGVETTAFFPEDGCGVDVLVYGFTPSQFAEVDHLRRDVYALRHYLKQAGLPHAVAHATYSVNGKLTLEHLEKLVLLFDVFEGINGGRNRHSNELWMRAMQGLGPATLEDLYCKHRIEPFGAESWVKGFTAGSDDHAGLFIARTYTAAKTTHMESFLESIQAKRTLPRGRHNDYQGLAFMACKLVRDFAAAGDSQRGADSLAAVADLVLEGKPLPLGQRLKYAAAGPFLKHTADDVRRPIVELSARLSSGRGLDAAERLNLAYDKLADLSDIFIKDLLHSADGQLRAGNPAGILGSIASALPAAFIPLPFLVSLGHLNQTRQLAEQAATRFGAAPLTRPRRALWFRDGPAGDDGLTSAIETIATADRDCNLKLKTVTCGDDMENAGMTSSFLNLPAIGSLDLPGCPGLQIRLPSMLRALQRVCAEDPDEIYVSTPGPLGLLGVLLGRLLGVKVTGIFAADLARQAASRDQSIAGLAEGYTRWFYGLADELCVPSLDYMHVLASRGLETAKMRTVRWGIDAGQFRPRHAWPGFLHDRFGVASGINLLYAGPVSRAQNLDFLVEMYARLLEYRADVNLLIAGDGPYLEELRARLGTGALALAAEAPRGRVHFLRELDRETRTMVYSAADVFVYPSVTDPCGVPVLEAQACGLPALVSDMGGPREIVVDGETGYVVRAGHNSDWDGRLRQVIVMRDYRPTLYQRLRAAAQSNIQRRFDWTAIREGQAGHAAGRPNAYRIDWSRSQTEVVVT